MFTANYSITHNATDMQHVAILKWKSCKSQNSIIFLSLKAAECGSGKWIDLQFPLRKMSSCHASSEETWKTRKLSGIAWPNICMEAS